MERYLTEKQSYGLRIVVTTAVVYLVFRYLLPMILPFGIALLLAILIRPAVRFLHRRFYIPMAVGAGLVLAVGAGTLVVGGYYVGRLVMGQLIRLGQQLPVWWEAFCQWLWNCGGQIEDSLQLAEGTITAGIQQMAGGVGTWQGNGAIGGIAGEDLVPLVSDSLQSAVGALKGIVSLVVIVFVTIGATLITSTQLETLRQAADRSVFGREIRCVQQVMTRVGVAYGKTQLVIMVCTVIVSGLGLTILGDSYALLWAVVIGLVDALPLFGAGTILWPRMAAAIFQGRWFMAVGLAVIYGITNLTRQWLEARYMGDRIGISPLANLMAMYVGLQLFGILGLFLGPIGYLLIKESVETGEKRGTMEDPRDG